MLKDYIEVTKSEIRDAVRRHRGLDVPKESAERCLGDMNSIIFEEEPNVRFRLKDFLRLFYSNFCEETDALNPEAPAYIAYVYPEADKYYPEEVYPLVFRKNSFFEKKKYKIRIGNLRRFLAEYQKQTNEWISADDIMNAEIVNLEMTRGARYVDARLKIHVRIL